VCKLWGNFYFWLNYPFKRGLTVTVLSLQSGYFLVRWQSSDIPRFVMFWCFRVCCEHMACHVFPCAAQSCAMCSPVYCLAPPILLSEFWLICPTWLARHPPLFVTLFNLVVVVLFLFITFDVYSCSYSWPVPWPVLLYSGFIFYFSLNILLCIWVLALLSTNTLW